MGGVTREHYNIKTLEFQKDVCIPYILIHTACTIVTDLDLSHLKNRQISGPVSLAESVLYINVMPPRNVMS